MYFLDQRLAGKLIIFPQISNKLKLHCWDGYVTQSSQNRTTTFTSSKQNVASSNNTMSGCMNEVKQTVSSVLKTGSLPRGIIQTHNILDVTLNGLRTAAVTSLVNIRISQNYTGDIVMYTSKLYIYDLHLNELRLQGFLVTVPVSQSSTPKIHKCKTLD